MSAKNEDEIKDSRMKDGRSKLWSATEKPMVNACIGSWM